MSNECYLRKESGKKKKKRGIKHLSCAKSHAGCVKLSTIRDKLSSPSFPPYQKHQRWRGSDHGALHHSKNLVSASCHHIYFTDEEIEIQRGEVSWPRSRSQEGADSGWPCWSPCLQSWPILDNWFLDQILQPTLSNHGGDCDRAVVPKRGREGSKREREEGRVKG